MQSMCCFSKSFKLFSCSFAYFVYYKLVLGKFKLRLILELLLVIVDLVHYSRQFVVDGSKPTLRFIRSMFFAMTNQHLCQRECVGRVIK